MNYVVRSYATFVHLQYIFERCPVSAVYFQKSYLPFALVIFRLNYDLHVVFYVGFRNFRKNQH